MAFFKEKRTGNLGTVTAVDWGRSIGKSLNYDALNKYYQRKFDQKIKDLELTPQVFDTTLSFLEPKIQSKVLELQNEYKSNADISYRKADFSDAAINARQRNAEILKELANMEAGIQSLEEAEAEFANNPDAFFPHEINSNLSGNESKLREAYTELINGDYKTGKADVVKDVYFKNGKTIVNIEGLGDIELNELRPFDQPREGLYSEFTTQLADIATTASTNTAEASALLTKTLGSIDNDLNYSDIQDLLDFKITIPSEFSGVMSGTRRLKDDDEFRKLFEEFVENASDYEDNWQSFFNPEVRREQKMKLKAGVDQDVIVQGVERFVRKFVERVGNQFINAGKLIQQQKRQQEIDDALLKSGTDTSKELKSGANTVINNAFAALEKDGFVGANGKYYKGYGTVNQVEITPQEFEKIYMRELGGSLSSSNEDMYFQDYIQARDSFVNGSDMKEAMAQKLADDTEFVGGESDKHKAVVDLIADIINGEDNYGGGAAFRGSAKNYFTGGDRNKIFTPRQNKDGMTVYNINQEVIDIFEKLGYIDPLNFTKLKQNYATPEAFRDVVKKLAFNRYVPASEYENEASLFKVVRNAKGVRTFSGVKGSPLSKSGLNQLNQSIQTINVFKSTQLRGLGSADGNTDLYEGKYDPTNVNKQ